MAELLLVIVVYHLCLLSYMTAKFINNLLRDGSLAVIVSEFLLPTNLTQKCHYLK